MKRGNKKAPEERSRDRLEDYKKEFRRLKKENDQLRKQISRLENRDESLKELLEEFEQIAEEEKSRIKQVYCPKCKSTDITILGQLRDGIDYYDCNVCGSRGQYGKKVFK